MKIYNHPMSSNARRATMTALLLEVPFETLFVDLAKGEQRKPEFLMLNPSGKVPVLVDGDMVLSESMAIMIYLAEKKGATTLYPADLKMRATINQWLFWCSNHWSPAVGTLNYEHFIKAMMGQGGPDPVRVGRYETTLKSLAAHLDAQLAKSAYLCGDTLTLADLSVACSLMTMVPAKLPVQDFAHVMKWFGKVTALEAWKKTNPQA
jgi:glutathione S-transferase